MVFWYVLGSLVVVVMSNSQPHIQIGYDVELLHTISK